ncbi:MAG: hypothetical protein GF416_07030 [Candidatus Altiarchaeales archaeon]|nr:hypothetical protein [Candidatus Altiarchaeales archaeon]MBD3416866.1 hypothetical protein [Candidatus Altiarchaeales archaeon]
MVTEMLRSIESLKGETLEAVDGPIGTVKECYFEDDTWNIRYLVADTRKWLPGRKVLIIPDALKVAEIDSERMPVKMTKEQIENSPGIEADKPVSRQDEERISEYYKWPPYWSNGDDPNLRSTDEIVGYDVFSKEGKSGVVDDLIIDLRDGIIRYFVVVLDGASGKRVLLSPAWDSIEHNKKKVVLDVEREKMLKAREYMPDTAVNREYEEALFDYYGRLKYWI